MTDLHSGNARTSPMAGTLDGFRTDFRRALERNRRERRSWLASRTQQDTADETLMTTVLDGVERVRGADRVAAQKRLDATLDAAQSDEKLIRGLRADLALATEHRHAMEDELTETQAAAQMLRDEVTITRREVGVLRAELEQAQYTITELQGQAATHECMPLPQRHPKGPQWSEAAQEPSGATETAKRPTSRTAGGSARSKPAAKRTAPRPTVKEG